ncbi:hypothetical protein NM688_g2538 [Phlebia brevispora]|uniref:Uncharacterized protein n=1 Tax=Phlebia brevispora TaxID=194682 RepID=A0ACC1T877_9APHY|nr:hypothetical protein NM688_g2538 [Phlebia brevispora]
MDHTTWLEHFLRLLRSGTQDVQAYSYAQLGATVHEDLGGQLRNVFERFPVKSTPTSLPSLDPDATLYVIWLGINDCGTLEQDRLPDVVTQLFEDGLSKLYIKAGARKFLLIDVPPMDRSPLAATLNAPSSISEKYVLWNDTLRRHAGTFASENPETSVFIFSSYQVISSILHDPEEYGFQKHDVSQEGGAIWLDGLHFTSDVHHIIAERLAKALHKADRVF